MLRPATFELYVCVGNNKNKTLPVNDGMYINWIKIITWSYCCNLTNLN